MFTKKTGLQILKTIHSVKPSYGKTNLSKIIWHEIKGFSLDQSKDLLSQLMEKGYLQEVNVGTSFAIRVITLTEKGTDALTNNEDIALDFQRFYTDTFKQATDIGIVDKEIIEEYYTIKKELIELKKREEELKETIKTAMNDKNILELHTDLMDLYCKKIERITYPKDKIEEYVPAQYLDKIRTVNEITVLTAKLKETLKQ